MLVRCCTAVLLLTLLTGCGDDDSGSAEGPGASTSSTAVDTTGAPSPTAVTTGTQIVVDDSDFGPMLFDATGQAIYLFDIETTSKPECYDECADAWPPVLTEGEPVAGEGVASSLLGTTKRTDGSVQVTYNDHPLYFYANEGKREVKCHDIFLNGGKWYVVQPGGDPAPPG